MTTTEDKVDTSMASPLCVEQSAKWLDEMHDQHTDYGEPTRFSGCASTIRALAAERDHFKEQFTKQFHEAANAQERCDELERLAGAVVKASSRKIKPALLSRIKEDAEIVKRFGGTDPQVKEDHALADATLALLEWYGETQAASEALTAYQRKRGD